MMAYKIERSAYAAMFGHMTDVGGKVPGSLPTDAREIFEQLGPTYIKLGQMMSVRPGTCTYLNILVPT